MTFTYTLPWYARESHQPITSEIDLIAAPDDDHLPKCWQTSSSFYEHDLLEHLAARGPRGGIFIDAGANVGNHSVFFGKFLAEAVVSVEPSPEFARLLTRNLKANRVHRNMVIAEGLGATPGWARTYLPPGAGRNPGMTRLKVLRSQGPSEGSHGPPEDRGESDCAIRVTTLDDVATRAEQQFGPLPIRFLKIDVEGMEADVLRGGEKMLQRHRPQLAVELFNEGVLREVTDILERMGYRSVGRFCATPTFHFIDPEVHRLRDEPSRITKFWHERLCPKLGI